MAGLRTVDDVRSVLLVEAQPGDALLLGSHVRLATGDRAEVIQAETLAQAVRLLQQRTFDLVLLDPEQPDCQGEETIRRLLDEAPDAALVVVTGEAEDQLGTDALRLGAQDHLPKDTTSPRMLARVLRYAMERKRFERKLAHLSQFDQLTGLANAQHLRSRLLQSIARAERQQLPFSVVLIDLDGFKALKYEHGYGVADAVLEEVGSRLTRALREYDVPARMDGDEFALLLDAPTRSEETEIVSERVWNLLHSSVQVGEHNVQLSATLGAAHYPDDGTAADQLLHAAAERMRQAKLGRTSNLSIVPPPGAVGQ